MNPRQKKVLAAYFALVSLCTLPIAFPLMGWHPSRSIAWIFMVVEGMPLLMSIALFQLLGVRESSPLILLPSFIYWCVFFGPGLGWYLRRSRKVLWAQWAVILLHLCGGIGFYFAVQKLD